MRGPVWTGTEGTLPYWDCKKTVQKLFPIVFDTKFLEGIKEKFSIMHAAASPIAIPIAMGPITYRDEVFSNAKVAASWSDIEEVVRFFPCGFSSTRQSCIPGFVVVSVVVAG